MISLHLEFCKQFGKPFIKAIPVSRETKTEELEKELSRFNGAASILLDTDDRVLRGGSGTSFNWDVIPENARGQIILAGGLSPENVGEAVQMIRPYAVDVSSGVEKFDADNKLIKGVKDKNRIEAFVRAVQLADGE